MFQPLLILLLLRLVLSLGSLDNQYWIEGVNQWGYQLESESVNQWENQTAVELVGGWVDVGSGYSCIESVNQSIS